MASTVNNTQESIPRDDDEGHLHIRDYQVEMVNKSLEGNLIVVVGGAIFALFSTSNARRKMN